MRFSHTDGTQEDDVAFVGQELQAEEVLDLEAIDFLGPIPAELFERFQHREAGGFDAQLDSVLESLLVLAVNEATQIIDVTAVLLSGPLRQFGILGFNKQQPQVLELLMQQCGLAAKGGNSKPARKFFFTYPTPFSTRPFSFPFFGAQATGVKP